MLMGLLALVILAVVPVAGGDLRRLAGLRLGWAWLLPLALGLQVLVITVDPRLPRVLAVGTHLATYALAAAFLWRNRRVPGLPVLAVGAASNGVTIAVNGGVLPASASAVRRAGLKIDPAVFTNSGVLAHPRLPWLGDVFAVPSWMPLANVFSVGDVLILVGAGILVHVTCRLRAGETGSGLANPAQGWRTAARAPQFGGLDVELTASTEIPSPGRRSGRPVCGEHSRE